MARKINAEIVATRVVRGLVNLHGTSVVFNTLLDRLIRLYGEPEVTSGEKRFESNKKISMHKETRSWFMDDCGGMLHLTFDLSTGIYIFTQNEDEEMGDYTQWLNLPAPAAKQKKKNKRVITASVFDKLLASHLDPEVTLDPTSESQRVRFIEALLTRALGAAYEEDGNSNGSGRSAWRTENAVLELVADADGIHLKLKDDSPSNAVENSHSK